LPCITLDVDSAPIEVHGHQPKAEWNGMGWLPPSLDGIAMCQSGGDTATEQERTAIVDKDTVIGVDLAKNVFQLHGASASGHVKFRKKLTREQFRRFMAGQPPAVVAMEACGSAHYWAREMEKLGHMVRLIAVQYVKPFVKRQKNDAADAEAIVIAARQPEMRFVAPKTAEQQARAVLFRARQRLVHQRTELVNALRATLYEYGYVAPQGICHLQRIEAIVEEPNSELPVLVREECRDLIAQIAEQTTRIEAKTSKAKTLSADADTTRRLQTMPGVGPMIALALEAFAPPMESFRRGRDFAAWLGLVPRQHSSGGKERLGRVSKAGQADIRRLLIIGAMSRLNWMGCKTIPEGSWLAKMRAKKPRMLVAIALANKMARAIWAMLIKKEDYRDPAQAVAA
jgi:transposase